MKYIYLLLMVLLPFVSKSQNKTTYIELDTSSVNIDNTLTELILDNFVADAIKYGLDSTKVIDHIKSLDAIYVEKFDSSKFGVTIYVSDSLSITGIRGIILINSDLLFDYSIFQLTLYHELGHWFGLKHSKRGIMFKNSNKAYKVLNKWDKNTKKLMSKIRRNGYSYPELDKE